MIEDLDKDFVDENKVILDRAVASELTKYVIMNPIEIDITDVGYIGQKYFTLISIMKKATLKPEFTKQTKKQKGFNKEVTNEGEFTNGVKVKSKLIIDFLGQCPKFEIAFIKGPDKFTYVYEDKDLIIEGVQKLEKRVFTDIDKAMGTFF